MNPTHLAPLASSTMPSRKRGLEECNSQQYGSESFSISTLYKASDENGYVSSVTLDGHMIQQHPQKSRRTFSEPVTSSTASGSSGILNTPTFPPLRNHHNATSNLHMGPILHSAELAPSSALKSSPSTTAASIGHSSNQLDNFQLDNSGKGNGHYGSHHNPILVKPKAFRCMATNNTLMHTPRSQPPGLPTFSSFLSPKGPSATPSTALQEGLLSKLQPLPPASSFISSTSFSSSTINRKSDSLSKRKGLVPASTNHMQIGTTDDRSSDEEFSLDTELSMSQDKMQNLSVHEVPEEDLIQLAQTTHSQQSNKEVVESQSVHDHVVMHLCPSFVNTLSSHEVNSLQEGNVLTIPLTPELSPITIGRDQFLAVFGDKIRGCETFHLSRRHCVFHVTRTEFLSHQFRVVVENTSTNGLDVNGRALKYGGQCELRDGDKVTLLKFRTKGEDTSLSYIISYQKGGKPSTNIGIGASPRPGISSLSQDHNLERRNVGRPLDPNVHPVQQQKKQSPAPVFVSGGAPTFTDIHIDILIADPVAHSSMLSRHPPSRGYRDELSSCLSVFSSVSQLQTEFDCATSTTMAQALGNKKEIIIYAGDREMDRLVTEDDNGMPSYIEKTILSTLTNETSRSKLLIVFAPSIDCAQLFVDAGFLHVIFVNASMDCRPRAISYLRALVACLLKGLTVSQSHRRARGTARGYSDHDAIGLPCVCGILPDGRNHDTTLGTLPSKTSKINTHSIISTLNAALIPMLGEHFVARDTEFAEVMKSLRTRKVRVCSLIGAKGVGKSSIAVHVAKSMVDRHRYRNGVHYMNIATEIGDCNGVVVSEKCRTAYTRVQNEVDELVQLLAMPDAQTSDLSMLLVLDGCDAFDPTQLHNLVINALQMSPNVQILIIMRQELKINSSRELIDQDVIHVNELSPELAAALLLSTARVCLDSVRLKSVLPSEDELISHPALTRLKGNPLFITELAVALKTNTLTELS